MPSDDSVGAVAVIDLVDDVPMAVMALFQKLRASVSVLVRHWSVAECASVPESLPNTVAASESITMRQHCRCARCICQS
jgi:hypothetical protein